MLELSHTKELVIRGGSRFLLHLRASGIVPCSIRPGPPFRELLGSHLWAIKVSMTTSHLFKRCTFGLNSVLNLWKNKFAFLYYDRDLAGSLKLKSRTPQLSCIIDISCGDYSADTKTVFCVSGCLITVKAHQRLFFVYGKTRRGREERKVKVTRTFFFVPFPCFVSSS